MENTKVTKDFDTNTLTLERVFDAPREKVWQAFSDKDKFSSWWGPEGWETTVKEFSFVPGGRNHYCMKCVDKAQGEWYGQESWGLMNYQTIDEPHAFTYKDYFCDQDAVIDESMPALMNKIELVEEDGRTRLVGSTIAASREELEKLIGMGMIEGWSSSMNKLNEFVTK
jgi:uncharacterized protein YndB with AHSA1/START domain